MLVQALIIGFLTWFAGGFMVEVLDWVLYAAPLVSGTLTGLVLGDVQEGMLIGATIQLVYMGQIVAGGVPASDQAFAGFVATALAMLSHSTPQVATTIAVSLGFIGLLARNLRMTANSIWVHRADKCAANGDTRGIFINNYLAPQIFTFLGYGLPAFLAVFLGKTYFTRLMDMIPQQLLAALQAIGTVLPALGIALLLKAIFKAKFIPYFVIGFVLAIYLKLDIIAVTLIGGSLAAIYWVTDSKINAARGNNDSNSSDSNSNQEA